MKRKWNVGNRHNNKSKMWQNECNTTTKTWAPYLAVAVPPQLLAFQRHIPTPSVYKHEILGLYASRRCWFLCRHICVNITFRRLSIRKILELRVTCCSHFTVVQFMSILFMNGNYLRIVFPSAIQWEPFVTVVACITATHLKLVKSCTLNNLLALCSNRRHFNAPSDMRLLSACHCMHECVETCM